LSEDEKKERKKARKALQEIAEASGGLAFFPEPVHREGASANDTVEEVESICTQVAHDIRNQYTLAYYPSNAKRDGSFRTVQVEVIPPRGHGKLTARTRNGYYAPGAAATASSAGN
jgi:VWFA-related protein